MTPPAQLPARRLRVAFAGTPAFAAAALRAIAVAGYPVVGVLTQPDRPAGRGLALQPSEVKRLALELHAGEPGRVPVPVVQPRSLRFDGRWPDDAQAAAAALRAWAPDVMVVAAYGLLLPAWALTLPRLGCLNIHGSLLPRWRGAAPIHRAVEAGDSETGITIMQMDEGLDTGPMLLAATQAIGPEETTGDLHDRLAALGAQLVVHALDLAEAGELHPRAQPGAGITYAQKVDKAEALVDWAGDAEVIARRVRAFNPAPGAATAWRGQALKLWRADAQGPETTNPATAASNTPPGTVIAVTGSGIAVACGRGVLWLTELQRAGGRRLSAASFVAGQTLAVGERLG